MRRTLRKSRLDAVAVQPSWDDAYRAFLEQSRWLLDQEQSRSAGFQKNAVAMLGFAGVVLTFLATNDFLAGAQWWSFVGVFGRIAVILFAFSALFSVRALTPHGTGSVNLEDTIADWAALHNDQLEEKPVPLQHFTHMLLAIDAKNTDPTKSHRAKSGGGAPRPPLQVLREAKSLADRRADQATWAARLMAGGVAALMLVVLAPRDTPGTAPGPAPTPIVSAR